MQQEFAILLICGAVFMVERVPAPSALTLPLSSVTVQHSCTPLIGDDCPFFSNFLFKIVVSDV